MSHLSSARQPVYSKLASTLLAGLFAFHTGLAAAGALNIADNALEIATGVDPNIMILSDDSGSMDSGIMSPDDEGILYLTGPINNYGWDYYYTHPAPGATGNAPSINANFFVVPDPVFLAANGVAAPQGGAWRAWNSDYNAIYYNPNETYTPWKGVDVNGNPYTNIDPAAAPYNPYRPAEGNINLTATLSYTSDCGADECIAASFIGFTVTDFYPARYYTWDDSNDDGIVDADEQGDLVEITDADELVNFANWFSYYRKRDLAAKNAYSKVIEPATSARIGFAGINNNASNRIQVKPMNVSATSGNKLALLDEVFSTQPGSDTPLRQNLEAIGEYFACSSDNIFGTTTGLSPAEEPGDTATANNCPVFKAPAGTCQQNFTIVMTDGFWNGTDDPGVGNADEDGTGSFDGASFADDSADIENTLADVAMHYYERDLQTGLDNEVPTTTLDRNRYNGTTDPFKTMHQHMATYTVGFGVDGTLTANPPNSTDAFAWPDAYNGDAEKIDDLRHAAWNGRGDFLSASDPDSLATSLDDIFSEIAAGTGAASSVAFNTQNLESGALVFRAFFDTTTNTGSLIAQDVSITGEISDTIRWSASEKLDSKTGNTTDTRDIVSFDASTNAGIPFKWASLNGNNNDDTAVSQKGHLNLPIITGGDIATAPDPLGEDRLNYLRGQSGNEGDDASTGEFRDRPSAEGKLGDIIHSSPVFVGKPPFSGRDIAPFPDAVTEDLYSDFVSTYGSRREIVYVGANDGMLHGFDANTGEEVFAYVPNLLFPELSKLTDQDYTHQFFVDMSPAVNDVVITPVDGTNQNTESWNSILVGGLGAGGAGYFALNVTDPNALDTEAEAADNVLWEFTQADDVGTTADDNDQNLGISLRQPLIAMSNIAGTKGNRWVAIFGNGYNSASTDGDAELYILFLDGGIDGTWTRGTDFIKINTGNGKAEGDGSTPNGLGSVRGIDTDNNGTVDAVYAGDLQGNVYRFDLSGSTTGSWSLPTGNPLFTATYKSGGPIQPITNRPIVTKNTDAGGYMVIVGTGSYFTTDDASSTDIQSIYGLWDDFSSASDAIVPVDYARLLEQTLANATSVSGFSVRTLTNNDIASNAWGTAGQKKQGWVIDLDVESGGSVEFPGERAIRNLLLRGSYVFVNTVIPKSSAACTVGPGGFEYAFNPLTGGSGADPAFDLNNDGDFDDDDNVGGSSGAGNVVSGIRFDESTPTDSSFIGNRKVTQTSDKSIRSIGTNTGTSPSAGRHSWREIEL